MRPTGDAEYENVAHLYEIPQNHVPMRLEDGQGNKQHELGAVVVRPEHFPQPQDVFELKLPLEGNEDPSEKPCPL